MLKKIILVLAIIVAIPFITALFVKKDYAVTTSLTINKPVEDVYGYVKYLKNQDNFSVWSKMDPKMKKTYLGTDGTEGFVSAWESDNPDVGVGEQEIKRLVPNQRIDFELRFYTPFESTDQAFMTTQAVGDNQTLVSWGFSGHMAYPSNLLLLVMDFDAMIANDLNQGLANLKTLLEGAR